jgi:hypothetical protein
MWKWFMATVMIGWCSATMMAIDRVVSTTAEFRTALRSAMDGDRILLQPGVYNGGSFRSGLTGVSIRAADPANAPIIRGGVNAIQLSDARRVTIEHLIFEQQTGNGINIDDGGSFDTPSTDITLRNLTVRNIVGSGNLDGIKLSGVTGFLIDSVQVFDWGDGGSAVDMVGSHHGLIQNSLFRHDNLSDFGSGLRPKGGSKNVTMRANRIELPDGKGRAIQAGGSTGVEFFRFINGDSNYEACAVVAEGNVILGGSSPFSYVNIDGGWFHHNYSERPFDWVVRILNENPGNDIVDTRNGVFTDNVIRFHDTATEFKTAVNVGSETVPRSFTFARNQWYNEVNPARSRPDLPVVETDAIIGQEPSISADGVIPWRFDWGTWLVNATENERTFTVDDETQRLARPADDAEFHPLKARPFAGSWSFGQVIGGQVPLSPFSQAFLVQSTSLGDFNRNDVLDAQDIDLLSAEIRAGTNAADFDLTGDARVDQADRETWVREIRATFFGDANLDGEFNSSDLVAVFQTGLYENAAAGQASWATGDWNGDARFTSGDLVLAFQDAGFESGPRPVTVVVPETRFVGLVAIGVTLAQFDGIRRRRRASDSRESDSRP